MRFRIFLKLSVAFLILTDLQASHAEVTIPFSGFYIGAFAGGIVKSLKSKLEVSILTFKANNNPRIIGFLYGLMAGYGCRFNNLYLGTELGVQHDTTNRSKNYNFNNSKLGINNLLMKAHYKRTPALSVAPRFGVIFDSYMLYLKPTLEISKDWVTFTDSDGDTLSTKKKVKFIFAPGIGLEKAFNHILVRLEYNYSFGAKVKKSMSEQVEGVNLEGGASLKYTAHTVKVGMTYQF